MSKYSIIDIETTGGQRDGHKITEIAIINLDDGVVVDSFSTLINPERSIPLSITYFTGITNEMVAGAPKFYEVARKIIEMTEERIFVAHNVFFDFNFIKHEFADLGYQFKREKLCTVRLARKYLPGHKSYSLGNICSDLGIEINGRHRAMGDASATVELFKKILPKIDGDDFVKEKKKTLLPAHLNEKDYEKLPHAPGVYYFYDKEGKLLYIGKSKDIKKRVSQHFRPDLKRKKDIQLKSSIARIEFKKLGNELAALLFECHEIKDKRPSYNVSLKSRKFTYGVKLVKDKEGVLKAKVFSGVIKDDFIYIFKSKHAAKRKIDSTYRNLLGDLPVNVSQEVKIHQLVTTLGLENYNKMINKIFHFNIPEHNQFTIEALGPDKQKCFIEVENKNPTKIIFREDNKKVEEIALVDDPQLKGVLWNYQLKYKLNISVSG